MENRTAGNSVTIVNGAGGSITDSRIALNEWDIDRDWTAAGFLIMDSRPVELSRNVIASPEGDVALDVSNEQGIYNTEINATCNLMARTSTEDEATDAFGQAVITYKDWPATVNLVDNTFAGWNKNTAEFDYSTTPSTVSAGVDELTGQGNCPPIAPTNVVVEFVPCCIQGAEGGNSQTVGQGDAWFFTDGKLVRGKWSRTHQLPGDHHRWRQADQVDGGQRRRDQRPLQGNPGAARLHRDRRGSQRERCYRHRGDDLPQRHHDRSSRPTDRFRRAHHDRRVAGQ
jgi:hypothetical protein